MTGSNLELWEEWRRNVWLLNQENIHFRRRRVSFKWFLTQCSFILTEFPSLVSLYIVIDAILSLGNAMALEVFILKWFFEMLANLSITGLISIPNNLRRISPISFLKILKMEKEEEQKVMEVNEGKVEEEVNEGKVEKETRKGSIEAGEETKEDLTLKGETEKGVFDRSEYSKKKFWDERFMKYSSSRWNDSWLRLIWVSEWKNKGIFWLVSRVWGAQKLLRKHLQNSQKRQNLNGWMRQLK